MLGIRLEPELAIRQYLEDREDYLKGIAALQRCEPTISSKSWSGGLASVSKTWTIEITCTAEKPIEKLDRRHPTYPQFFARPVAAR